MKPKIMIPDVLVSLGLLGAVAYLDFITGYKLTFLLFYLLPILYARKKIGQGFAFAMAIVSAVASMTVDAAAGDQYADYLTPIWNTGNRLAFFLLVVIMFSNRDQLRRLVAKQTQELLQESRERSRLEKEILGIAEAEQRRIGHDLHDSLGQHLTATALAGKLLAKRLGNQVPVDPALSARVVAMLEEAIDMTRNFARMLHPIELGEGGLGAALHNLAADLSKAFYISCRFQHSGVFKLDDLGTSLHLYRIAQEAASNAIRHGKARNLVIALDATTDRLLLTVTDDGTGLPPDARTKKGMGLRIMNYRADSIGAEFDIQNLPAGGARAVCVLNLSEAHSRP
jgi:signal transduction histidine kinase